MFITSDVLELPKVSEEKFIQYVKRLQILDPEMESLLQQQGFTSEAKLGCPPFRLVRTKGERVEVIDFAVHQEWRNGHFEPQLQYSLEAICHHLNGQEPSYLLTKRQKIVQGLTFDELALELPRYIDQALQLLREWTPEVVASTGLKKGQFWSLCT